MTTISTAIPEISVVIPMFRESSHVVAVLAAVREHLSQASADYEIIMIDDGSPDDTWTHIAREALRMPCVRAIRLSRNFGKEHAVAAGLESARGRAVIVMDGDLQHPPSLIPAMVERWRGGEADVVEGVKSSRGDESIPARLFAGSFYRILKALSGFNLEGASDFKLMDRKVVSAWLRMRERNLFFRGMVAWLGYRRMELPFEVAQRVGGRSRWTFFSLVRLALTAMTAFSSALLQLVTFFGIAFLAGSLILGAYTVAVWARGKAATGFTTVILLLLMIGGVLMISLGIIGLYLARIYDEIKGRPRYLVSETVGFEQAGAVEGAMPDTIDRRVVKV